MPKPKKRLLILIIFLLAVLSLFGIPATINLLFKQTSHIPFFIAEWSAGEALNYYGAVLTFFGTSLLNIVALWQNHLIKVSNEKHMEFLETLEKEKFIPKFMISNVCILGVASNILWKAETATVSPCSFTVTVLHGHFLQPLLFLN